jgi:hypothetical protein
VVSSGSSALLSCVRPKAKMVAVSGARVSFGPLVSFGVSFGDRLWWYDVHQVEGAV